MMYENEQQRAILAESLEDMDGYLARVSAGCIEIGRHFQAGNSTEAVQLLVEATEGLGYLNTLIDTATMVLGAPDSAIKGVYNADSFMEKLNETISEITEAIGNKDYSLAGDLVEYNLADLVVSGRETIHFFRHQMGEGGVS